MHITRLYSFFLGSKLGRDIVNLFKNSDCSNSQMEEILQDYFDKWFDTPRSVKLLGALMSSYSRQLGIYKSYDNVPIGDFSDDMIEKIIPFYRFYIGNRDPEEEKRYLSDCF